MNVRPVLVLGFALLAGGCAYYNGMYNARRLARQAEKAEREGRTFDAANLWGQAGVKADTVLARHGDSQWADDALLIRGKAYQRLGDCTSAVTTLRQLLALSPDPALQDEGSFLLGRCYQSLGEAEQASDAFARILASRNPALRSEALYQHGHSLVLGGNYAAALEELEQSSHPRAAGDRAAALAGLGRTDDALRLTDSLLAARDTAAPWGLITQVLGRRDPAAGSRLVDRILAADSLRPEVAGMLLVADAERLRREDPDAAAARYRQAIARGGSQDAHARARVGLFQLRMDSLATLDSLKAIRVDLPDLIQLGGQTGIQMARYHRAANQVVALTDSVAAGASVPDLRLFLAAEITRDSLGLPRLAAPLFRQVAESYPESPYAPKSLLALLALNPEQGDALRAELTMRYPESPYFLAWQGEQAPRYTALEDSLSRFITAMRQAARQNQQDRQAAPTQPNSPLPLN